MDDQKLFEDEAERPRLKVTDHRKFATDGTLLEPDTATPPTGTDPDTATSPTGTDPESAAPPTGADTQSAAPATGTDTESAAEPDAIDDPTAPSDAASPSGGVPRTATPQASIADLPRDFSAFVESMHLEAMLYLGAIPDPRSGETIEDTELAKYKIDLLGMLQEKTDGNLTPEEKQQLDEVLYQLRMVYLQKTQATKL
ncbi:MAG: DUF1844 domain-containing protein [Acidobacteria bacterium]|nr:DUF1844 domain-containing protein [Acidobacteriota bacterium]